MSSPQTSLTVRKLSPVTKARLAARAKDRGRSLEAEVRSILDAAAESTAVELPFPDCLLAVLEPGEDISPFLDSRRTPHRPIAL